MQNPPDDGRVNGWKNVPGEKPTACFHPVPYQDELMLGWPGKILAVLIGTLRGNKRSSSRQLECLERQIGYRFNDRVLLFKALSHLSWVNDQGGDYADSNERLEFLGDAVLDLVVSDYLYARFESAREGKLTRLKSSIVSRSALAAQAAKFGLEEHVIYSRDNFTELERGRQSMISNCLEAIIGAIYLDGGLEAVRSFVFEKILDSGWGEVVYDDFQEAKNTLLHISQVNFHCQPNYQIVAKNGPEHAREFICEVRVAGRLMGSGSGASKKDAEKQAAMHAVERLEKLELDNEDK
ncbi:MAG: ribonuclease III [Candidatus Glassbacteria bacterium]|nr:ribonuclease III [Candidatus Glassbacteria bacterium]